MKNLLLISIFLIANLLSAQDWQPLSMGGADNTIHCVVENSAKGVFYAGGTFSDVGGLPANKIAMNDGISWNNMNGGVTGNIRSMEVYNGKLYVGGIGAIWSSAGLAVWNDTLWSGGTGIGTTNTQIFAMTVYNGKLYVGVSGFSSTPLCRIYEWDGVTRTTIADFTGTTTRAIYAMEVHNGELYVGGYFTGIQSSISATNLVKWDGATWNNVGSNGATNGKIYSLKSHNGDLYVGGSYQIIDGVTTDRIIKRSSGNWVTIGVGMDNTIYKMHSHNGELYVSGSFTLADNVSCSKVAKLSGSTFTPVGTGMNTDVVAMCTFNNSLYAGGYFTQAGGQSCGYTANFGGVITGVEEKSTDEISIYPNPSNGLIRVDGYKGNITVYSSFGSEVYRGASGAIDLSGLKGGIYFVSAEGISKKIIIK